MRIDGSVVHYLLNQRFDDVVSDRSARRAKVDYPMLYDVGADMSGHTVLIPKHERPHAGLRLDESICLCMSNACATATREAGFPVIEVRDDVTFPNLYNYLQTVFVRFERLDALLHAYVDTRAGAQPLLDACAQATGLPFALVDEQYRDVSQSHAECPYPADAGGLEGDNMLDNETIDLFMASQHYRRIRLSRTVFAIPGSGDMLAKNLFVGTVLKGMVICRFSGGALSARYAHFILNYLSEFIEEMLARMGSFGISPSESDRIRSALSQLLSDGTANQLDIQSLLVQNGHEPDSSYAVLHIRRSFTYEGPEESEFLARRFELSGPHAYCFVADGNLFMLADIGKGAVSTGRDFLNEILVVARDNLSKVGISRSFTTMDQLDAARIQATAALNQGSATDPTYWFYRFDDYALSWLIAHGRGNVPAEYVAHPAVTNLARHDAANRTELLRTLSTFVRCRFNATKAAGELFVARSTLLNRLDRITELTGVNLEDPDDLVYLSLSLQMMKGKDPLP